MDYKNSSSTIDGNGNIVLQDVKGEKITINYNDTAAFEQLVNKISNEQLLEINLLFERQTIENKFFANIITDELQRRRKKTKILWIAISILGLTLLAVSFWAYTNYMQEFGFSVKLESVQKVPLENGTLIVQCADRQFTGEVNPQGEVFFKNIPAKYKGENASIQLEHPLFSTTNADSLFEILPNANFSIVCTYKNLHKIFGIVKSSKDNLPIADATVSVAGKEQKTNENGKFEIAIPTENQLPEQRIRVYKEGFELWDETITIDANIEIPILLIKK